MPRVVAALKREERAFLRRHFEDHVIEIVTRSQQTQPAADALPFRIHVDQPRDYFCLRIGMDFSILLRAAPPRGDHSGPACQIDGEFALKCSTEFRAIEIVDELLKLRPESHLTQRKAAGLRNLWVIIVD